MRTLTTAKHPHVTQSLHSTFRSSPRTRQHSTPPAAAGRSVGGQAARFRENPKRCAPEIRSQQLQCAPHPGIDVGGSHVKNLRSDARGPDPQVVSGPKRVAGEHDAPGPRTNPPHQALTRCQLVPGLVFRGRIRRRSQPAARDGSGLTSNFLSRLWPAGQVINDAASRAIGRYRGGRMLFLGLGTGAGCALIVDGVVEPTTVRAYALYKAAAASRDLRPASAARKRLGTRKWAARSLM